MEQIALKAYYQVVGLDLVEITVDRCIVKAPCGGEAAGKSSVDRGRQGTKRPLMTDAAGIPIGCIVTSANRHDSPFLRPTLERLSRFETRFGLGLPDQITVHLDAGYDSAVTRELLDELGCRGLISNKGFPLQAGARWVVERTSSWHNRGFRKLAIRTEKRVRVIDAFIALCERRHHPTPRPHRLDHPPLGEPTSPTTETCWPGPRPPASAANVALSTLTGTDRGFIDKIGPVHVDKPAFERPQCG